VIGLRVPLTCNEHHIEEHRHANHPAAEEHNRHQHTVNQVGSAVCAPLPTLLQKPAHIRKRRGELRDVADHAV